MADDDKSGTGVSGEVELAKLIKLRGSVSDSALDRFFPVERDELTKFRNGVIKDLGKSARKKIKSGRLGELGELERLVLAGALGDLFDREIGRLQNRVEAQVAIADERAAHGTPHELPPATPESEAFAERFWDEVGDVSDADVRRLYAQAAVRELYNPKSISANTLSVLRRLDAKTVASFEAVSRFVCNRRTVLLPSHDGQEFSGVFEKHGITADDVNHLISVGLFLTPAPWLLGRYQEGSNSYVYWRFGDKTVRVEAQFATNFIGGPASVFVNGMAASTAAMELWAAIRPQPAIEEVAVSREILRVLNSTRSVTIMTGPEEAREGDQAWLPHAGAWPL